MFFLKLVLSVLVAVAAAAPSGYHGYAAHVPIAYDIPEYHVSKVVEHVPTAVSHQSRVDYHSKPVITPIIAPVTKVIPQPAYAVHQPAVIAHSAPLIHSAPIVHSPYAYHGASLYDAHAW